MPFKVLSNDAIAAELGSGDVQIGFATDDYGGAWVAFHVATEAREIGVSCDPEEAGFMAFAVKASEPWHLDVVERTLRKARDHLERIAPPREPGDATQ